MSTLTFKGLQDTKTASADNRRNADGMLKQKEEFDMEVLVDDFEMCGGSRDSLKEGVSKTPETGDKGGEERKERLVKRLCLRPHSRGLNRHRTAVVETVERVQMSETGGMVGTFGKINTLR